MSHKQGRLWVRFSLRTLFIVMTALACWLGWQLSVVRERQAVLKEFKAKPGFYFTTSEDWRQRFPSGNPVQSAARISFVRGWLGDQAIQEIWCPWYSAPTDAELSRLNAAFPEAQVRETLPEPCHPGCFPQGTLVETPTGPRRIETIGAGDPIVAIHVQGEAVTVRVQSVFVTDNRLWKVETGEGSLITTQTQPLCLATDKFVQAGDLQRGERILKRRSQTVYPVEVLGVSQTDRTEKVYNLILGDSEVFVASGFLARSKPPAEVEPKRASQDKQQSMLSP